ncbi:hypothetical protein THALO_110063 [Tenacibaculum halocynthiae]
MIIVMKTMLLWFLQEQDILNINIVFDVKTTHIFYKFVRIHQFLDKTSKLYGVFRLYD